MKGLYYLTLTLLSFLPFISYGQGYVTVVFDSKHLAIVGENGVVRSAAEASHINNLKVIKSRLDDITINLNSVVLVQDIIYRSLTEVDQALRSGLTVKQIVALGSEIFAESNLMLEMAKDSPHLLLFAEEVAHQLKNRGINLVAEVSEFVLKEGSNVLMEFSKRDQLLRKIVIELRVIRALVFSMHRTMYWAKARGVLRSLNPYSQFIYQDKRMVEDIIYKINQLKN